MAQPEYESLVRQGYEGSGVLPGPVALLVWGRDTVSAAAKFVDLSQISYVCTGGGAMVRFLSGVKLPLLEAMRKAFKRDQ